MITPATWRYHVLIAGSPVAIVPGSLIVNEALDNMSRVCEFALASQPDVVPEEGDTVRVQRVDVDTEEALDVFGGTINVVEVESSPWAMIVRSVDQLEKLRRVPSTSDRPLTGKTDGEAVMFILDNCDIDYDPADIQELAYTLGSRAAVNWPVGVPGVQVLQEIDTVTGFVTETIGNNRVVRFRVENPPESGTGAYRTYEKGVDADWSGHRRSHGERDAIQNLWIVRGVSTECGTDGSCTCQPWAKAVDGNPQLGSKRVRVTTQEFSSDLIQDEDLAEYIVRMMMKRTNKLNDTAVVTAPDDPLVHPGWKIGLIDATFGIDAASVRYVLVQSVDRSHFTMTLQCVAGPPGSVGTVTTGVDKACNDTHSDVDWPDPGGFDPLDPPDFDLPTLDLSLVFDLGDLFIPPLLVVGGSGGADAGCTDLLPLAWVPDNDVWGPPEAGSFDLGGTNVGTVNPIESPYVGWGIETFVRTGVPVSDDWTVEITGTHTLNDGMIALQCIDNHGGAGPFVQSIHFQVGATGIDELTQFMTDSDFDEPAVTLDTGAFTLIVSKLGDAFTATYKGDGGVTLYEHSLNSIDWDANASGDDLLVGIVGWTEGTGGSVLITGAQICPTPDISFGTPTDIVWVDDPEWPDDFTISGNDLDGAAGDNATALSTTLIPRHSSGLCKSFRLTWQWQLDGAFNGIEMIAEDSTDPDIVFFWQPFFANSTGCYFLTGATYSGSATDPEIDHGAVTVPASSNMELEWDRVSQTFTLTRDGSALMTTATDPGLTADVKLVVIAGGGPGYANCHDAVLTMLEA